MADRDNLDSSDALDEVEDERRLEDEEGGLSGFEGGEDVSLPGASEEEEEDDDDEDLLDQDMDPNASESRGGSPDPLVSSSPRRGSTSAAPRRFSLAQPVSPTKLYGHHHRRAQTPPSDLPPAHSQPLHQHPGMPSMEDDIMEGQDEGELSKDEGATGDEDDRESYDQLVAPTITLHSASAVGSQRVSPGGRPFGAGATLSVPRRSPRRGSSDEGGSDVEDNESPYAYYMSGSMPRRREASPPLPLPPAPVRPPRQYTTPYLMAPPTKPPRVTGLAYDPRMLAHRLLDEEHDTHPENPERVRKVWDTLTRDGLAERCNRIPCRDATIDELSTFHSPEMIKDIIRTTEMNSYELRHFGNHFNSLYVNHESYASAMLSCGSVIEMCSRVARGELHNGVCVVRPPGHHAEANEPMGFCVFNNVAVAANILKRDYGMKRILILDWDVHHGNGTQNAFYSDPAVLYMSIHRYDGTLFYPNSNDGAANAIGEGPGIGFNVNVPWEGGGGLGDADYIHAFQKVIMPIAYEYNPDFVIISAGFDAAMDDPLGGCRVTPYGYAQMTYMLSGLAGGRVVVALEGGYNARSVSLSMAACTAVLLGDLVPSFDYGKVGVPCRRAYEVVEQVVKIQSRYWDSMLPRHHMRVDRNRRDKTVYKAASWTMQEVLAMHRHLLLASVLGFTHFHWHESWISSHIRNRFHGDVHVFGDVLPLQRPGAQFAGRSSPPRRHPIIFVHETPSVRATLDPYENVLERGSSHLLDPTISFLKAITTHVDPDDILIFDIEIDMDEMKRNGLERLDRIQVVDELLSGIWEELIGPSQDLLYPAVLVGIGNVCTSVVNLVNHRQIESRVAGIALSMGDMNPPSIIYGKEQWYYDHSRVVLAHSNPPGSKVRASPANGAVISAGEEGVTSEYVFSLFRLDLLNFVFHQLDGLIVNAGWENEFESGAKVQLRRHHQVWHQNKNRAQPTFIPPPDEKYDYPVLSDKESEFDYGGRVRMAKIEVKEDVSEDELADLLKDAAEAGDVVMEEADEEFGFRRRKLRRAAAEGALQSFKEEKKEGEEAGGAGEDEDSDDGGEFDASALPEPPEISDAESADDEGEEGGYAGDGGFQPSGGADDDEDDEDLLKELEEEDLEGGIEDVELPPEYAARLRALEEEDRAAAAAAAAAANDGGDAGRGGRKRRAAAVAASAAVAEELEREPEPPQSPVRSPTKGKSTSSQSTSATPAAKEPQHRPGTSLDDISLPPIASPPLETALAEALAEPENAVLPSAAILQLDDFDLPMTAEERSWIEDV